MDLVAIIDYLIPSAKYSGVPGETEETFNRLNWEDVREKPTWGEILEIWPIVEREIKLLKLRSIRDYFLSQSDWITSRIGKEKLAIDLGLMTANQQKWTNEEITQYLYWCQYMCYLPETIDIDSIDEKDINANNKTIFLDCPIDTRLTAIGDK